MEDASKHAQTALAVLRIVTALLLIEHGAMKLAGFPAFGVGGAGDEANLSTLMLIFSLREVFGGLAVLTGLLTRPVAFLLSGQMGLGYWTTNFSGKSAFPVPNGGDGTLLFCFIFLYLASTGPGAWSFDAKMKRI
ncbi:MULTISPECIES: DoxX family protein [Rhizobium]|uniref:DoxX family protein n=3 Tax=Rhizobium TaxID=379 RepID=A0A6P1CEQ5_RHITR|nr:MULTISPECIES: DoxX family protein [Rhizobium]AGB73400.1 DoxX family protein [Rhizobium tropici CIAT 899]AYG70340.1 DoxX family protein [Rhizobium sp. CCGE531]AYG76735.1 DoxX family protein [Rhizobium sp. CCGE532]ENN86700.1 DoxX family protein [Rhizobium freirei PRF 81]MBB4245304.1 putative oxidoreductase [Rhizobium tropici]